MKRRDFLGLAAKGALGGVALGVVGCSTPQEEVAAPALDSTPADIMDEEELVDAVQNNQSLPELNWEIATSWPLSLDTIYGGAVVFAETVTRLTNGKFQMTPRAAGELAGGTQVLDVVEQNSVQIGHTASYYYVGKSPATAFGTALPFGLTARQQNAWLYEGGGLELMQDFYRERFGVIQFPAGNTGVQMGGWFNKEINSVADLAGLKMRIPGLGGQVMDKLGVTVQVLPGGEIFQALQTGAIDAAEWVGPYDDTVMGFNEVTSYYYYPGWWEPGPSLEVQINLGEWNNLPEEYQEIIKVSAYVANTTMMARYDSKNPAALDALLDSDIELRPFPNDVLQASEQAAFELYDEFGNSDSDFASIFTEWKAFRDDIQRWFSVAETAMLSYESQV